MTIVNHGPLVQPVESSRSPSPAASSPSVATFSFRGPSVPVESTPRYFQPAPEASAPTQAAPSRDSRVNPPAASTSPPDIQPLAFALHPGGTASRALRSSFTAATASRPSSSAGGPSFAPSASASPSALQTFDFAFPASKPTGHAMVFGSATDTPAGTSPPGGGSSFTSRASASPPQRLAFDFQVPGGNDTCRSIVPTPQTPTSSGILSSVESPFSTPASTSLASASNSTPRQLWSPFEVATPSRVSSLALSRSNTPSVSVTPPVEGPRGSTRSDRIATGEGVSVRQISSPRSHPNDGNGLRNSSSALDMSVMVEALKDAATSDGQRPTNLPPLPSPLSPLSPPSSSRRRRSGSRAKQIPYQVEDEEPPRGQRFFERSFQETFGKAKNLMVEVRDVLRSSNLHEEPDTMMRALHTKAAQLAAFRCPSTRTVGFVGDSGVGKSSLLNSLLDCKELARTGSGGAACTCAATEYHYHDRDDFRIEVILFSQDDIDNQLRDLLRAYRQFHQSGASRDQQPDNLEADARVASDLFKALFRGQLTDFSFLQNQSEDVALQRLCRLTAQARPTYLERPSSCATLKECSDQLQDLSSERLDAEEPALWPYIKKIRVNLRAHILNRGLVLVDLPGLRDLNRARLRITQRYLVEDCDEILAVCHIGRATTDEGVVSIINLATEAELTNIGIVCTNSENIKSAETARERPDQAEAIQEYENKIKALKVRLEDTEEQIEECCESDDSSNPHKDREAALHRMAKKLRSEIVAEKLNLSTHLIQDRNRQVTRRLRTQYGARVPRGSLGIHCVSNLYYDKHRNESKEKALPYLDLSGVPDLRRHCIGLVADSQLHDALAYIQHDIPALIAQLEVWIQNGAGTLDAEKRRAIRQVLDSVERDFQSRLNQNTGPIRGLRNLVNRVFENTVCRDPHFEQWAKGALNASLEWDRWNAMSYKVFCANYGDHGTASQPLQSWNHQAMDTMLRDLTLRWQVLNKDLRDRQRHLLELVDEVGDSAVKQIDDQLKDVSEAIASVVGESTSSRQYLISDDIERCYANFVEGLAVLRMDALTGIRTSIFGNAMKASYDQANAYYGSGSDRRRKTVIGNTLQREDLFVNHITQFRLRFRKLTDDWHANLSERLDLRLSELASTFDMVRQDNAAQEGDEDTEFRDLLAERVRTAKVEVRNLQAALDR